MVTVKVTYTTSLALQTGELWNDLFASIAGQMPLRNLHWRSSTRPAIRTVQQLDIDFIPLSSTQQLTDPLNLFLDSPFLEIYFLACDDVDQYRSIERRKIQEWRNSLVATNQDWFIVLLVKPDTQGSGKRLFQKKSSVLDKMKSDFNADKRERCVQLQWAPNMSDPIPWADFLNRIKEGVVSTINLRVLFLEEEARKCESQRQQNDWSFCTLCALKETLASLFERMDLLEDAAAQFDELEAFLYEVSIEWGRSPFNSFGGLGAKDDSLPMLSASKKSYRELIVMKTISEFDFRIFLVARQCHILARCGEVTSALRKCIWFIQTFSRAMLKHDLHPFFVESWIYSASLNAVDWDQTWVPASGHEGNGQKLDGLRGELLELAKLQLDKIGMRSGHIPVSSPFATVAPVSYDKQTNDPGQLISHKELISAVAHRGVFDKLYDITTHRAIECYTAGNRKRAALKLHGYLAAFDFFRDKSAAALLAFTSLPPHYASTKWTALEGKIRRHALQARRRLAKPCDQDWILTILSYLRCLVALGNDSHASLALLSDLENEPRDAREEFSHISKELHSATSQLTEEVISPSDSLLTLRLGRYSARFDDQKRLHCVPMVIVNKLPFEVRASRICVGLSPEGRAGTNRHAFASAELTLLQGPNTVEVWGLVGQTGQFPIEEILISISNLTLRQTFQSETQSLSAPTVHVSETEQFLQGRMELPRQSAAEIGSQPFAIVELRSGPDKLQDLNIVLEDCQRDSDVVYLLESASLMDVRADMGPVEFYLDHITISSVSPKDAIRIAVPFTRGIATAPIKSRLQVTYRLQKHPQYLISYRQETNLQGNSPVFVNVREHIRSQLYTSRFTVSSDSSGCVRIKRVSLNSTSKRLSIRSSERVAEEVLTPAQSINFVFQIHPQEGTAVEDSECLAFHLVYRTLDEELDAVVTRLGDVHLTDTILPERHKTLILQSIKGAIRHDEDWARQYAYTQVFHVGKRYQVDHPKDCSRDAEWKDLIKSYEPSMNYIVTPGAEVNISHLLPYIRSITLDLGDVHNYMLESCRDRELILPVELPAVNVLNRVDISVPNSARRHAGRPVDCTVSILTSFQYRWSRAPLKTCRLRYDVHGTENNVWLISGPGRGEYFAKDGDLYQLHLSIVPLRHGILPLPSVEVEPVCNANDKVSCTHETYQEHAALRVEVLPAGNRSSFLVKLPIADRENDVYDAL